MAPFVFMSAEHVARMNELLAGSDSVLRACAELDRNYEIAYELKDGAEGTVHWVLRFGRVSGAVFSLAPPRSPDITYIGAWADTIRDSKAMRDGEQVQPTFEVRGDPAVIDRVGAAYTAAHAAATVPIEFPQV